MTNKSQITRHQTRYHQSRISNGHPLSTIPNNHPPSTSSPSTFPNHHPPVTHPNPPPAPPPTSPILPPLPSHVSSPPSNPPSMIPSFSRQESQHYFIYNQKGNLGPASLVSLAHFKNRHAAHQIPPQHVYNQILISQLASTLTRGQNKNFAHLLQNLLLSHNPTRSVLSTNQYTPSIPITYSDIRSKCTEGPNSVVKNLPYPAVQTDVSGHCYVKISDVLEDFLAHGFLPLQPSLRHSEQWVNKMCDSPQLVSSLQKAIAMYGQEQFYFLAFKEWQDDYESQYAKTDRCSVWCKNITILAEPGTPRHLCTYPIAFSTKQGQHHSVENKLENDMERFLGTGPHKFYSSKLGKQIPIHACLYVSLADQPERRTVTGTTAGNHNYHTRFGYSIKIKAIFRRLPSCQSCSGWISSKMDYIYDDWNIYRPREECEPPYCPNCLSWLHNLDLHPNLSYAPPENYPPSELHSDGNIRPFQLTFDLLIAACYKATEKISNGNWTVQQGGAYLDTHCIVPSIREDVVRCASLRRQMNTSLGSAANTSLQERIEEMQALDPQVLEPWSPPAIWSRSVSLSQHLDAPMHLIFHGIIKGIGPYLKEWLKSRNKHTSFCSYYTGLLEPIAALSLDWCKLTPFSGSFAGWLAENYVGLSKISLWFWSGLFYMSEDAQYEQPTIPYTRWTGQMCKDWLKSRRMEHNTLTAAQAKEKVTSFMTRPAGPPPIPPPIGGSIDTVFDMLISLDKMVRILMASAYPVGGRHVITLHILHFLNAFSKFKPIHDERKFPEWLTCYNYLCLLNLPDAIQQLGPLRFNYEGGSEGEGFIPMVKPLLSQGMRKNWQKNLAHRFFRIRAMKFVIRDARVFIGQERSPEVQFEREYSSESSYTKKMFHRYKKWEQVNSLFCRGMPISMVVMRSGFVGAVIDDRDSWLLVPVVIQEFVKQPAGLHQYFRFTLFERDQLGTISRHVINFGKEVDLLHFVILLPYLDSAKYVERSDHTWTMVGSEYEHLARDGRVQTVYHLPINIRDQEHNIMSVYTETVQDNTGEDDGVLPNEQTGILEDSDSVLLTHEIGQV